MTTTLITATSGYLGTNQTTTWIGTATRVNQPLSDKVVVGVGTSGLFQGFMSFDTSAIPADSQIVSARLTLRQVNVDGAAPELVVLDREFTSPLTTAEWVTDPGAHVEVGSVVTTHGTRDLVVPDSPVLRGAINPGGVTTLALVTRDNIDGVTAPKSWVGIGHGGNGHAAPVLEVEHQPAQPVGPSFWSLAPSDATTRTVATWAPTFAAAGITDVRAFRDDATQHAALQASGMELIGVLQKGAPGFPGVFPIRDLRWWAGHVADMVARYPGVTQWEVWNEPPNFAGPKADPAHYGRLVTVAHDVAKAINPDIKIYLAAKSTHIPWLAAAIVEGGCADKFDGVTLHPYERGGLVQNASGSRRGEVAFMGIEPTARAMLTDVNPTRADVPLLFTELGIGLSRTATPWHVQAQHLTKLAAMSIAQGVEQVAWFEPRDGGEEAQFGLMRTDGTLNPGFHALKALRRILGRRPTCLGWSQPDLETHIFAFEEAGTSRVVLVAWSYTGHPLTFAVAPTVVDIQTDTTTAGATAIALTANEPAVLILGPADSAAWRANVTPPGGAYGLAAAEGFAGGVASVSPVTGPRGLALINPPAPTTIDGRLAWDISNRVFFSLTVDPAWASWHVGPVRLTIDIKALSGTPGFNVRYDAARSAFVLDSAGRVLHPGWKTVPGAGAWSQLVVDIPDFSVHGVFGVSIELNSDAAANSGYAVSGVQLVRS